MFPELEEQGFHMLTARRREEQLHGHAFLEFSYILSGAATHYLDGNTAEMRAGDFFIVDYGTRHAYRAHGDEPFLIFNFIFYPQFIDRALADCHSFREVADSYLLHFQYGSLISSPTGRIFHDDGGKLREIVEDMMREYEKKRVGYKEYIRCRFLEALILVLRRLAKEERRQLSAAVEALTVRVREHYAEPLCLSALAAEQNYSLSHLSKKFAAEVGERFSDYLQRVRIEQSCRLLETTELPITAVAEAVGYENVRFFNRVFRRLLHTTPREYRKNRPLS